VREGGRLTGTVGLGLVWYRSLSDFKNKLNSFFNFKFFLKKIVISKKN